MNTLPLYEELRLIERNEESINRAWKDAHLLLFFLAFVFGSFCTFCFHMLMYLFDEKCVLFPKLLSLTSMRHNVIYEFLPPNRDSTDMPVDFLSTQWVDAGTCSLPTLQRPWRVLPPVFVFSVAMGGLCVYTSVVTHNGLQELCIKLGEITGSSTCSYTVNVVTLAYERRIRGVYQATRLTILTAWLHTTCWLCSALLAFVRIILAVDFELVRVSVNLHANLDRIMELDETHIKTYAPEEYWINTENDKDTDDKNKNSVSTTDDHITEHLKPTDVNVRVIFETSEIALLPEERRKLAKIALIRDLPKDKRFIGEMVFDLIDELELSEISANPSVSSLELTVRSRMEIIGSPDSTDLRTYLAPRSHISESESRLDRSTLQADTQTGEGRNVERKKKRKSVVISEDIEHESEYIQESERDTSRDGHSKETQTKEKQD